LRALGKVLGQGVQKAWLNRQLETHARYIESYLSENSWFAGEHFSMADIQMSFPVLRCLREVALKTCRIFMPGRKGWKCVRDGNVLEQGGPFDIPGEG
jgi:glutathione S-transferase